MESGKLCSLVSIGTLIGILLFALAFHVTIFALKVNETVHCDVTETTTPSSHIEDTKHVDKCALVFIPGWVAFLVIHIFVDVAIAICVIIKSRTNNQSSGVKQRYPQPVHFHDNKGLDTSLFA